MTNIHEIKKLPSGTRLNVEFENGEPSAIVLTETESGEDVYLTFKDIWAIAASVNFDRDFRQLIS